MNVTLPPLSGARQRPRHAAPHYLWLGIAASLGVHALLMAWTQAAPSRAQSAGRPLAVALVNARIDQTPLNPTLIALQNVAGVRQRRGGGAGTHVDRPASRPALNLAARRIVQLAAPFPSFQPELAATTDQLTITRSWHFLNDTLDTSAP